MVLGERLKRLRKELGLTQSAFAERIGSVQNTVTGYESGRRNPSAPVVSLICREFNVNEHWLRTGEGEMFIKPDTFSLDEYAKKRGATDLDLAIAKVYFDLPPTVRADMLADLKRLLVGTEQAAEQEPAEEPPQAAAPRIAAVPARPMPDPDRAALEREADEFAAVAREQFILQKKRESEALSAKSLNAG